MDEIEKLMVSMAELRHPNIVLFMGAYITPAADYQDRSLGVVWEHMQRGVCFRACACTRGVCVRLV